MELNDLTILHSANWLVKDQAPHVEVYMADLFVGEWELWMMAMTQEQRLLSLRLIGLICML